MPTKPTIPTFIDNDHVLEVLCRFADLISETVNFGTHVLDWQMHSATGGDENIPITLSLRHFLELQDSIANNMRCSCVNPCKLVLRGALETFFTIAYIAETDSYKRAMAYMATYAHQRIKIYKRYDISSNQGREFLKLLQKDRLACNMKLSFPSGLLQNSIENMQSLLKESAYKDAEAEYQRCKIISKGDVHWYSLFNGPKNIEQLANHLRLKGIYEILYRSWSGTAHGTDIIFGNISRTESGKGAIRQIRLPTEAQALTMFSITLSLETFRTVINLSVPNRMKDYKEWYIREIRPTFKTLTGEPIIHISEIRPNGS